MADHLSELLAVLSDVIVPNLTTVRACQAEQQLESDRLEREVRRFREEMNIRFAELRSELAAIRVQLEATERALRDSEIARASALSKAQIIH